MFTYFTQSIAAGASTMLGVHIVKGELAKPSVVRNYKRVAVGAALTVISVAAVVGSTYNRYQELTKN